MECFVFKFRSTKDASQFGNKLVTLKDVKLCKFFKQRIDIIQCDLLNLNNLNIKKRAKDHATNDCNLATKTAISLCNQVVTHIIGRLHGG